MLWMTLIGVSAPVFANEGDESGVKDMLNDIPEIVAPVDPAEEVEKPKVVEGMDLDGYYRECRTAVYRYFKAPKSVVKQQPDVEVTFVVKVDAEGNILGLSAPQRSGYKSFDQAALKALNKAGRLPAPPAGWNASMDKVLIPFNAESGR